MPCLESAYIAPYVGSGKYGMPGRPSLRSRNVPATLSHTGKCVGVRAAPNSGGFNSDAELVPNQLFWLQVHLCVAALVGAGWSFKDDALGLRRSL